MQRVSGAASDTQSQISTGRKFLSPADDPVAATRILQINQELAIRKQYQRNINSVTSRLSLEDATLDGVSNLLQRVREIAIQMGDGSLSQTDRGFLAAEIEVRTEEMLGLLNSGPGPSARPGSPGSAATRRRRCPPRRAGRGLGGFHVPSRAPLGSNRCPARPRCRRLGQSR